MSETSILWIPLGGKGKECGAGAHCLKTPKFTILFTYALFPRASPAALVVKSLSANAGYIRDAGLIPGSGRSPGGGTGYPHQYSWASLVAQTLQNLTATWKTWVRALDQEDALEEGMATHPSILG